MLGCVLEPVKKIGPVLLVLALLLGGGAGSFLFRQVREQGVLTTPGNDPYGDLSQAPAPLSPGPPSPAVDVPQVPPVNPEEKKPPVVRKPQPEQPVTLPPTSSAVEKPVPARPQGRPVTEVLPRLEALADVKFTAPVPGSADGWYDLGVRGRAAGDHRKAAKAFAQAAALNPSAANWRALADEYVALRRFNDATRAYDQAAAKYRARGDDMTARALEYRAAPYRQTLNILTVVPKAGATQAKLAKFEPSRGVMLGLHVSGAGVVGAWGKPPRMAAKMKPFTVAFRYWKFTKSTDETLIFPGRFARAAKSNGMALHLALEPGMSLNQISDTVIKRFAQQAKAADLPIFVRFASEMNDPRNDWSSAPALYRKTFRRVAEILHQDAPNVAMVWMPMPGDLNRMHEYYPGPDAVDWAGLSLYSVPFENGDITKSRLNAHPLEVLDGFYRRYAPAHPIQLSEYAASNRSGASPEQDFGAFAAQQLREVYWGAWMNYPRLKNINWLDIDMHTDPLVRPGSQERKNDYRLFGSPAKWKAFTELRGQDAFYQSFKQSQCRTCSIDTPRPFPLSVPAGQEVQGALWIQAAQPIARVVVGLDGRQVEVAQTLPYHFTLNLTPGKHRLQVWVIDANNRILNETERVFVAR